MNDRRIARRFDLSLTVIVRPLIETESGSQVGTTRDISTQGVYFTVDSGLSVGAELVPHDDSLPPKSASPPKSLSRPREKSFE